MTGEVVQPESGRCSACGGPAARTAVMGDTGGCVIEPWAGWWHLGDDCGQDTARFRASRQQAGPPRDRQIRHPGRDR